MKYSYEPDDLKNIYCIETLPEHGKIHSRVIYDDKPPRIFPVTPNTVIEWIAEQYFINLRLALKWSSKLTRLKRGAPVPISRHNVYVPFHRGNDNAADGSRCYCYFNIADHFDAFRLEEIPGTRGTRLILQNGEVLESDWSYPTLRYHFSLAKDTCSELLHRKE